MPHFLTDPGRRGFPKRRWQPRLERLEPRLAPACSVDPGLPNVVITCGVEANTVTISQDDAGVTVTTPTVFGPYACDALFESLTVNLGGGSDTLTISGKCPDAPVTLNGGAGDDDFYVEVLGMVCFRGVTIDGQDGTDEVWINENSQGDRQYVFDTPDDMILCDGLGAIDYSDAEGMGYRSGPNRMGATEIIIDSHLTTGTSDPCNLGGLCLPLEILVQGGPGLETVRFRNFPTGGLTSIHSRFDVTQASLTHRRLGTSQVFGLVTFSNVNVLDLQSGVTNDVFNIQSTPLNVPLTVRSGGGNDMFNVGDANNRLDGIRGALTLDGQAGIDALFLNDQGNTTSHTYALLAASLTRTAPFAGLTYGTMENLAVNAGTGNDTISVNSSLATTAMTVHGGGGQNTLQKTSGTNTWRITAANAGNLTGTNLGSAVTFSNMQSCMGGSGGDSFILSNGVGVTGAINGAAGIDTLDYAAYMTSLSVMVNLRLSTASNVGGGISNIENVTGGSGNDTLVGNIASNTLSGGPGRDLLIGGGDAVLGNADVLLGGAGEDILIAGHTTYDLNTAALAAIMVEWTRAISYSARVMNLLTGTGVPALNAGTVTYNRAPNGNTLLGGANLDLFFGHRLRDTHDWDGMAGEWFAKAKVVAIT